MPPGEGIRCLGYVPDDEKWAALRDADLAVVPSPYESLSLALLESAAAGTPALVHGGSEVLTGQVRRLDAGVSFPDWDAVPEMLGELLADPGALAGIGERGRRAVAALPGWSDVLSAYRAMIDTVAT